MIINFLGDSITQGVGASSNELSFFSLLEKRFPNDIFCNYGLSGTRIARQENLFESNRFTDEPHVKTLYNLDFNARALTMRKDADLVFVFGGTNDFGHGSALLGEENDFTPYTFYGALNCLTDYLIELYGSENVVFILPLPRFDEDSTHGSWYNFFKEERPNLNEYKNAMKKVLKNKNINFLDFENYFPRVYKEQNEGLFFDGLHPNDLGHKMLADLLEKEIKNRINSI